MWLCGDVTRQLRELQSQDGPYFIPILQSACTLVGIFNIMRALGLSPVESTLSLYLASSAPTCPAGAKGARAPDRI